jgi:hypothetical protein
LVIKICSNSRFTEPSRIYWPVNEPLTFPCPQAQVVERYNNLFDPIGNRRNKLSDAIRLQQLFRDIEDEEDWIREKEPIAASTNRGECSQG